MNVCSVVQYRENGRDADVIFHTAPRYFELQGFCVSKRNTAVFSLWIRDKPVFWTIAGGALENDAEEDEMGKMYGFTYDTELGKFTLFEKEGGICEVSTGEIEKAGFEVKRTNLLDQAAAELSEYFQGNRHSFELPLCMEGTEFQKKVWNILLQIPYGETRSYKEVAQLAGNEKASRAVGLANNKNPLMIFVPCHRVIGTNGKLVGYAGGLGMKEKLLEIEGRL